jgi:hypothetical protein
MAPERKSKADFIGVIVKDNLYFPSTGANVMESSKPSTKASRHHSIVIGFFLLIVASIAYSPHRVTKANYYSGGTFDVDYIVYAFIWKPPEHSSVDFTRLLLTWVGIAALTGVALYINSQSKDSTPPP